MMLKRLGAFLLIVAFGFATVQSATAQDDDASHTVTIDVEDITELSIENSVELTFESANGADALSLLTPTSGESKFASATGGTNYDIQTNRDGVKLNVDVTSREGDLGSGGNNSMMEELGLLVKAQTGNSQEDVKLTELGSSSISGGELDSEFGPLSATDLNLTYEGVVTEESTSNAGSANKLTVKYTVTGN
ncbi:hypothetical protein [Salinibacter ruber]|uniref:hypothetical protein n=1 Tax=Salinibacter ruber TaxID=146919 RepID=UPI002166D9E8|nr:hypothetical protein [Salinibacter ruber]MCS3785089.1 hypothetical protein [Salinibacter ruber]